MPIFVDPNVINPEPPETVTSPDGILTATIYPEGVLLEADFGETYPPVPGRPLEVLRTNHATTIENSSRWSRGGSATVELSEEWALSGTQSVKIIPNGTANTSSVYPYGTVPTLNGMERGHTYTASATIRLTTEQTGALHGYAPRAITVANVNEDSTHSLDFAVSELAPNIPGEHRVKITFTVPEDSNGIYFRLMNGSTSTPVWWDGFMIEEGAQDTDYFDGDFPDPDDPDQPHYRWTETGGSEEYIPARAASGSALVKVRFERDGEPIFTGDPAQAVGGYALAFDHFAPYGVVITYRAIPIFYDGTEGPPSEAVAIVLRAQDRDQCDVWLKSLNDPSASMCLVVTEELPTFTRTARNRLSEVVNNPYPAGSRDQHMAVTFPVTFHTPTPVDQQTMEALLTSGPLLWQPHPDYHMPDRWVVVEDFEWLTHKENCKEPFHEWTVPFIEIAKPSTRDYPPITFGRTWGEVYEAGYTWASGDATFDSWRDAMIP